MACHSDVNINSIDIFFTDNLSNNMVGATPIKTYEVVTTGTTLQIRNNQAA